MKLLRKGSELFLKIIVIGRGGGIINPTDPHFGLGGYSLPNKKSRDQDEKSGVMAPSVSPKKSRGTKTFKTAVAVKPFWKNGVPKCKEGFSYDFKRKLCVKIK